MTESLMERFATAELFANLPLGDKLAGAGITTLMGMGTTFLVLILLWACIVLMSKIVNRFSAPKKTALPDPEPALAEETGCGEDALIALAAAAAVAAYEGEGGEGLVVRRISRRSGPDSPWSAMGRTEHN